MPDYLILYSVDSRLRSKHLEHLSFESNIAATTTSIKVIVINPYFFLATRCHVTELFTI